MMKNAKLLKEKIKNRKQLAKRIKEAIRIAKNNRRADLVKELKLIAFMELGEEW